MRIVLACDWWAPRIGGIESVLRDLAAAHAARGHDVHVLTTTRNAAPLQGVRIERIVTPMIGGIAVPNPLRISDLVERLEKDRPDVVHAHGMFSPLAIGMVAASARARVPSVLTIHSLLQPPPVFVAAKAIFSTFARGSGVVTGVSRAVAADIERAAGRSARVVPNGLDLDVWQSAGSLPFRERDEVLVAAVMRLAPKKRPRDLLEAFAAACAARPMLPLRLSIAGDGPERAALERLAVRLGCADRVAFLGAQTHDQVRALLSRAAVFAHPGTREAFGIALLEARAAGVPVVAMNAGGVPDVVEHNRSGLLAGSKKEFARYLTALVADTALRRRLGEAGRSLLDAYRWQRVASMYEAVYRDAVETVRATAVRSHSMTT